MSKIWTFFFFFYTSLLISRINYNILLYKICYESTTVQNCLLAIFRLECLYSCSEFDQIVTTQFRKENHASIHKHQLHHNNFISDIVISDRGRRIVLIISWLLLPMWNYATWWKNILLEELSDLPTIIDALSMHQVVSTTQGTIHYKELCCFCNREAVCCWFHPS